MPWARVSLVSNLHLPSESVFLTFSVNKKQLVKQVFADEASGDEV